MVYSSGYETLIFFLVGVSSNTVYITVIIHVRRQGMLALSTELLFELVKNQIERPHIGLDLNTHSSMIINDRAYEVILL